LVDLQDFCPDMQLVIQTFLNPVFPVFAVMLIGLVMGRRGFFDIEAARAVNKFVFYVVLPPLIFSLILAVPVRELNYRLVSFYLLSEVVLFIVSGLLIRRLFRRSVAESALLGMASGFVNHVFFIMPIVSVLYGKEALGALSALIFLDTVVVFGGMIVCMEIVSNRKGSAAAVLFSFLRNPVLAAMMLGLAVNILGIQLHEGVATFTSFAGKAAPPASLFALGVTLAGSRFFPLDGPASIITLIKIIAHPLLVMCLLAGAGDMNPIWTSTVQYTAAGPCGAMPFVLALQYKVRPDSIGLAIVYSTVASLVTLSIIA
jgi:malonate transporter